MKRIILFFTVCLGLSVCGTTFADNAETARAANKRTSNANISANVSSGNRVTVSDNKHKETAQNKNTRIATKPTQQRIVTRTSTTQTVKSRTPVPQQTSQKNVTMRSATKNNVSNRNVNTRNTATRAATRKQLSRASELNDEKINSIKSADYSKCKTVYYECMDEFCANKDTNLRRCACSARIHEFDNIKRQLSAAEDKMLDFNQRLLLVSLDKEDAAAVNVATEGELAFNTKDTSQSEKLLQKINKTLNNSGDSKINNNLSAISLSLDMDSAWDNVDSLSGVSTASKNGLDLYNAASPVCIEMAKEVCSDDELIIAQEGYKLTIQQDCNTVAKSYNTQYNNAMNKIHESGALLDMSRLNIYQQKNSDDTLTCKKKILAQLSDASVCGKNLYKCLDTTGQYIDPSTGNAFLSENLYNLTALIQEPTGDEKWSKIVQNEPFVNFLKSKKKFLTPAIEQCRDIADTVWNEFLDDALAQIKLAQNAKMEEIRQSCTTLIAECKTNAMNDLSEFDARALSVFNVAADKAANKMCADIQKSCVALMRVSDTENTWAKGMTGIAANTTFDAIINTCTQVGRDCIIQKCNGTSSNFALCTGLTSDNRISVLNRTACWQDVLNCVRGADNLSDINISSRQSYYTSNYSNYPRVTYADVPKFCDDTNDKACLIAEQIWGNCEKDHPADTTQITADYKNDILIPDTDSTLLSWFATNTNNNSCSVYGCPIGYKKINGTCQLYSESTTDDCKVADTKNEILNVILNSLTNYCASGVRDMFNNCCKDGHKNNGICVPDRSHRAIKLLTTTCNDFNCDSLSGDEQTQCEQEKDYYCPNSRRIYIYCITTDSVKFTSDTAQYECTNGKWIMVDQYGNYFDFQGQSGAPNMTYNKKCNSCDTSGQTPVCNDTPTPATCTYGYYNNNNDWSFGSSCNDISTQVPKNNEFLITWPNP